MRESEENIMKVQPRHAFGPSDEIKEENLNIGSGRVSN